LDKDNILILQVSRGGNYLSNSSKDNSFRSHSTIPEIYTVHLDKNGMILNITPQHHVLSSNNSYTIIEDDWQFFLQLINQKKSFPVACMTVQTKDDKDITKLCAVAGEASEDGTYQLYCKISCIVADKNSYCRKIKDLHYMETVLNSLPNPVYQKDMEGRYIHCNESFVQFSGIPRDEFIGQTVKSLLPPEEAETILKNDQKLLDSVVDVQCYKGTLKNASGENRTVFFHKKPLKSPCGEITGILGTFTDITDMIQLQDELSKARTDLEKRVALRTIELEKTNKMLEKQLHEITRQMKTNELLQSQLRQAQKMEAIGNLAGGIAHDFNNILNIISGYSSMIQSQDNLDTDTKSNIEEILQASQRAKNLVSQILSFSHKSSSTKGVVNLSLIIEDSVRFLRSSLPATVQLNYSSENELLVTGNEAQLKQIIINLCTNAWHAMPDGGTITLKAKKIKLSEQDDTILPAHCPEGSYIKLSCEDTGHGMTKELIDRIFEPYFTTKPFGSGAGLGLTVVHGIIRSHQGFMTLDSAPDEGSSFCCYLPEFNDNSLSVGATDVNASAYMGNGETILFLDDEPAISRLAEKMLSKLNYNVECFTSSLRALEAFRQAPQNYDMVITDLTMPKMTGLTLSQELLQIRSDIAIILCTGNHEGLRRSQLQEFGINELIQKPITQYSLSKTIHKVLHSES
jgi:PAS domain S-box-containing protein